MPNNKNERKGKQAGELSAEERFRNFFSTSVIDLPEEMTRRDEPAPVEEKPKAGLLGKLFGHDKEETPAPAQPVLEIPTGEILLGADAKPVQPEQEDMALELRTADPVPAMPMQPAMPLSISFSCCISRCSSSSCRRSRGRKARRPQAGKRGYYEPAAAPAGAGRRSC